MYLPRWRKIGSLAAVISHRRPTPSTPLLPSQLFRLARHPDGPCPHNLTPQLLVSIFLFAKATDPFGPGRALHWSRWRSAGSLLQGLSPQWPGQHKLKSGDCHLLRLLRLICLLCLLLLCSHKVVERPRKAAIPRCPSRPSAPSRQPSQCLRRPHHLGAAAASSAAACIPARFLPLKEPATSFS